MILLFLYQLDKLRPENLFGGQILERTPAGLSIIYLIGMAVLLIFLIMSFWGNFNRPKFAFEENLPKEVVKKLSLTLTNRSLRIWQVVFILLAFGVYGYHIYWTYYADEYNEQYQSLSYKDLRNRRASSSTLRGWMLDRTGKLSNALAYYKVDKDGTIDRTFPLEKEMAHLLGTERGTPGLERTLYKKEADPMPEAWEILTKYKKPEPENKDVRITIDKELQTFVAAQMDKELAKNRKGAAVVVNPQTGDVLAIYSTPTYSLSEAESLAGYLKLESNKMDQPLLSRALRQYYIPGSTFKTLTMMAAFRAGKEDSIFPDRPASAVPPCYLPFKGSKPICDAGGNCDLCTEEAGMRDAFRVSSNQFFAQLGNSLGREQMAETGRLVGIDPVETPEDARQLKYFPDIWNTSNKRIANSISPAQSMMVTGKKLTLYDFGIVSYGQGLAGQMTPFQMALIAATAGNLEGKLMKPKIEADLPAQMFNQVLTRDQGEIIRDIMSTVTEEKGGTATIIQAKLAGTGIRVGGKTGTADKDNTPLYNTDGTRKTHKEKKKNDKGELVEVDVPDTFTRWDGWFICIAPLENPQVAIAIVLENIGNGQFGGTTAAPVAAEVLLKARELGLLGDQYKPKTQTPDKKKNK
ncbi:MAG: penicillin-binding transpeptidase domain-containing protein [Actinomycetota bacterium]